MRKFETCRKTAEIAGGAKITLIYSITVDKLTCLSGDAELEDYGACIHVPESGETACIRRITPTGSKILSLANLLAKNIVTPVTLHDVVMDWIERD